MLGDLGRDALGDRSSGMPDGGEQLARGLLEVGEVVVLRAHRCAELGVGAARLLGRRGALAVQALDLALEPDEGLERVARQTLADADGRDAERVEEGAALGAFELDLERRATAGGLGREQVVERGAERARDLLELGEPGLPLAVLDHRHLRRRAVDGGGELVERHALLRAQVPDAAADRERVGLVGEREVRNSCDCHDSC